LVDVFGIRKKVPVPLKVDVSFLKVRKMAKN
jgi:hypothetical protein